MSDANYPRHEKVEIPAEYQQTIPFLEEKDGTMVLSLKPAFLLELADDISYCRKEEATDLAMQIYRGIRIANTLSHSEMVESENALLTLSKALGTEEKLPQDQLDNINPDEQKKENVSISPSEGFVFCYTIIDNQFKLIEIDNLIAELAKTYISGSLKVAIDMARDILTSVNYGFFVKSCSLMEIGQSITNYELSKLVRRLINEPSINSTESEPDASNDDPSDAEYDDYSTKKVGFIEKIRSFFSLIFKDPEEYDNEDYDESALVGQEPLSEDVTNDDDNNYSEEDPE